MAQPVWSLSVDLQTKTATFTSGLADAAKAARGSFDDIKASARSMGGDVRGSMGDVGYSTTEARHAVMMLGEEFGVHLPRGLTTFISHLGMIGPALEAAFPFLAVALGATLLIEHLVKLREESDKLVESQAKMGLTVQESFNKLDDKLLEVSIRADELSGNKLGALQKRLELLDHVELKDLVAEFGTLDKVSAAVLAQLKAHWYESGSGSAGSLHALEEFQRKYDALLATGKKKEAGDLLSGTLASANKVLQIQQQAKDNQAQSGGKSGDYTKYEEAITQLRQMRVGITEKEVTAQQTLVDALSAQVTLSGKLADITSTEKKNDRTSEAQREEADQQKAAEAQWRGLEHRISIEEAFYRRTKEMKKRAEEDKHRDAETEARELEAIDRTLTSDAIKQAEIRAKVDEDSARHTEKMAELRSAAKSEEARHAASGTTGQKGDDARVQMELDTANRLYAIQMQAFANEMGALDVHDQQYLLRLQQLQNREKELVTKHENEITQIKERAEEQRNQKILSAEDRFRNEIASGLTQVLMRHETFGQMMVSIGDQVISGMMQNAIKSILALNMDKEATAAHAARKAYVWGDDLGGPILGAALGAVAFSAVMAYEKGGIVPGAGIGDTVPAMLEPGEAVLPKGLTEGLTNAARSGSLGGGGDVMHFHHSPVYHLQMIDATGVDKMLKQHGEQFVRHAERELRRRNK